MPSIGQACLYLISLALGLALGGVGLVLAAIASAILAPFLLLFMLPDVWLGARQAWWHWLSFLGADVPTNPNTDKE